MAKAVDFSQELHDVFGRMDASDAVPARFALPSMVQLRNFLFTILDHVYLTLS